jgi:hypothetical protein
MRVVAADARGSRQAGRHRELHQSPGQVALPIPLPAFSVARSLGGLVLPAQALQRRLANWNRAVCPNAPQCGVRMPSVNRRFGLTLRFQVSEVSFARLAVCLALRLQRQEFHLVQIRFEYSSAHAIY